MEIKVFGPGCAKCQDAEAVVKSAVREAGLSANVEKISDFKKMMEFGIMSTPAVVINDRVMCTGRVPAKEEVIKWLAENETGEISRTAN